jgi:hypothetical protein
VSPSPGESGPSGGVSPEGNRAGTGDCDNARLAGGSSGECDQGIVRDRHPVGGKDLLKNAFLIGRSSAEAQASRFEPHFRPIERSLLARNR